MSISNILVPLNLSILDDDWVKDIWYREFLESIDLPTNYESYLEEIDISEILHSFIKQTKKWLDNEDEDQNVDKTWRSLVHEIKHKELTALLYYFIQKGHKNVLSEYDRVNGILSARTYFIMLMIPGSSVYRIFHSQMYIVCLSCFKFYSKLMEQQYYINDYEELNLLNRQLKSLLNDVHILLYNVNLKSGDDDSVEETICCLVEFIGNTNVDSKMNLDKIVLSRLQALALQCIDLLIQGEDDEQPDERIIKLIFKALLPKFTSIGSTKKAMSLWRASGVTYCGALLLKYSAIAMPGFMCLLQHLCYNSEGMERIDNRSSRVHLVVGLLSLMPLKPYKELLKWIVKLSRNAKPQLRLFAVEVLGSLVSGKDRNLEEAMGIQSDETQIVINPDMDNPSENSEPSTSKTSEEQTGKDNPESNDGAAQSISSDGAEPPLEEISVPTKHQEVAHRDLLKVVYERCEDVSSTVRTKAVSILAAFTSPSNQILKSAIDDIFHNDEAILDLAILKLKDERVTVRRTAMSLLENVFMNNEMLLTKENLEPLVHLCRDTSIMVRCAAISTLTGLATKFSTPVVFDAWLSGPLNQLSDPEVKVQDMVVEHDLRNLLITPLKPYSTNMDISERRPWLLLAAITRKNMRRHLARSMTKLAKTSKVLSFKLVDILYTHIGTENNLSCWVLLSTIARHINVGDIRFVLDYYNDMNMDQERLYADIRLISLVLEVLREWSKCIPELNASILRSRLVRELCEGTLPAAGARGAVALCIALSKRMGDNSDWAANLVREGELKMISSWRNRDNGLQIQGTAVLTVADLALASDRRPSPEFLELLIELSGSTEDNNDLNINVRACAVAALGKLSIRERNTASVVAPLCAKLLITTQHLPIKVNAMCVLADLCTRFTSIVEPMLPSVCACLGSPEVSVRRCATQLVTQLLVGDFLRLRGSLYFHYFPLICDEDETVKDIANYYILNCLVQRNKNILYHNFVECIFYYNKFEGHSVYGKFHVTEEEKKLFTLHGDEKREIRLTIYDLMLSHMSDIHRLNTQMKLCKEAIIVGETGDVGMDVLRDAVSCLRRAAKVQQVKQQSDDLAVRVAHNIVSQKTKLNVIETVVPTVIKLHRKLRTTPSNNDSANELIGDLVSYACDLLKDYKQEIEELFEADIEFMQEIKVLQSSSGTPLPTGQKTSRIFNTPAGFDDEDAMLEDMIENIQSMSTPLATKKSMAKSSANRTQSKKPRSMKAKRSLPLTPSV